LTKKNLKKQNLYLLGWITLLLFPLPAYLGLWYFEGTTFSNFLQMDRFWGIQTGIGIELGIVYAFLCLLLLRAPVFETLPNPFEQTIRDLNLTWYDSLFISLCAGIGEELLFRAGIQQALGIWITSLLFVAIHGYFHPLNWQKSLYGLAVFPFVLLLGFAYDHFGLWFCIGAHASYNLVLFAAITQKENTRTS
jgi:uncharacterized protein